MIHNQLKTVNKNQGVKIPNARVELGGTRAFTLKAVTRPQSRG